MGEFGRILTNLGMAYGLMNKEQFVDKVAQYAQEKNMSEEKMMGLVENLFEEIEITHRRRQARQMYEAYRMKKQAEDPSKHDIFEEFEHEGFAQHGAPADGELLHEIKSLRSAIENLTAAMKNKSDSK